MVYRFGPFEADDDRYELRKAGRIVPVQRRTLDLILFLASREGRLITPADLIAGPWQGTAVSNAALSQAIMQARRALADGPALPEFITTVRGKGIRFDAHGSPPDRHSAERPSLSLSPRARPRSAEGVHRRIGSLASRAPTENPQLLLDARLARLNALLQANDGEAFRREAHAHRALAERLGHPVHGWYAEVIEVTRLFRGAKVARAASLMTARWERGLKLVGPMAREVAAAHLLNLALEQTGPPRRRALERVRLLTASLHRRQPRVMAWRTMQALAELQLGDPAGAQRLLGDPARLIAALEDGHHLVPTLISLVDLLIAFRDAKHLQEVGRALRAALGLNACLHFADWGPVAFHLARVARELGEREASRRLFEQALAETKRARSICWESWVGHGLARALADSGESGAPRRAAALLRGVARRAAVTELPALSQVVASFWPFAPGAFLRTTLMKRSPAPQAALKRRAAGNGIRRGDVRAGVVRSSRGGAARSFPRVSASREDGRDVT